MFENIGNWIRKTQTAPHEERKIYKLEFFARAEHRWITEDKYLNRCFNVLIDHLGSQALLRLKKRAVIFQKGSATLACAVTPRNNMDIIIVFPDLIKLMQSGAPLCGVAVLAHELGHILLNHSSRKVGTLVAQLEADKFAADIGFGNELHDVLLDYKKETFCGDRLLALERNMKESRKNDH